MLFKNFRTETPRTFTKYRDVAEFIRFNISGSIAGAVDFTVFWILITFYHNDQVMAANYSIICGLCIAFFLNMKFVFRIRMNSTKKIVIIALKFITISYGLFLINEMLMTFYRDTGLFHPLIARVLSEAPIAIISFLAKKFLVFRKIPIAKIFTMMNGMNGKK